MTLIVAVADEHFALLATDTRLAFYGPGLELRRRSDDGRKLYPLVAPGGPGFCAGGPFKEWADYLYSLACLTSGSLDAIVHTIRAAAPGMLARCEGEAPLEVGRTIQVHATLLIGTDPDGRFYGARFDAVGERFTRAAPGVALASGPGADELPDSLRAETFGSYQKRLNELRGTPEIDEVLRVTGVLFHGVAQATQRVGPLIEMGVLVRDEAGRPVARWLPVTASAELAEAPHPEARLKDSADVPTPAQPSTDLVQSGAT